MHSYSEVLYYPTIELKDENWVKTALLYWERIHRIVPRDYTPNDSNFIKTLKEEGLIHDIIPTNTYREEAAKKFHKLITSPGSAAALTFFQDNENGVNLYNDKVDYHLFELFKKYGIVSPDGNYVTLPKDAAGYYMMVLANVIASRRGIVTGTSDQDSWVVNPYFIEKGNFDEITYNEEANGYYCQLFLKDVFPEDLSGISISDIISFHENRKDERKELRSKVGHLVDKMSLISDKDQLSIESDDLIKEIERAKAKYRKSQEFKNSGIIGSCLSVGLPVAQTCFSTINNYNPIAIGGSLILRAYAALKDYNKIKKIRNSSYQSYLVNIDEKVVKSAISNSYRTMKKFINN